MCKSKCTASKVADLIFTTKNKIRKEYAFREELLINLTLKSLQKKERKIHKCRDQRRLSWESVKALCQARIDYSQLPKEDDTLRLNKSFSNLKLTSPSDEEDENMEC
ncbi:hypothetical protein CDAR_381071 [Caerostris darwini]|uniref:Uncharacterized protein n=1 Tax=Caerostris darwini TaxID=1538125 RepID=A0AAV4UTF9_9ARAC|nr:hypothetical protein CDAR_381071 [Caerostris darwini]